MLTIARLVWHVLKCVLSLEVSKGQSGLTLGVVVRCSRLSDLKGQSGLTLGVVVRCSRLSDLRLSGVKI